MHVALVSAELDESLALRYLWGALSAAGHIVTPVVFNSASDTQQAAQAIVRSGADVVGLSMVFTSRAAQFADLATAARAEGFVGHIVAGGHFAAFHPVELLTQVPAIDSVAIGEGEALLCDLVAHLGDPGQVTGLVWRRGPEIVQNGGTVKPPDLDALPPPIHKPDPDRYLGLAIANVLGSRGCAHACGFCSIAAWHKLCGGARFRLRGVEPLADELAVLWRQGTQIFNFHDDDFLHGSAQESLDRADRLFQALRRRGVGKIGFAIKARPDQVDEALFRFLKDHGLFRVFLGIEAGSEAALAQLGRGQKLPDNHHALDVMTRLDLHVAYNLLMWNPWSTLADLQEQVEFLRRRSGHPMNFCRTEVYAGTPLERRLRREDRLLGDMWGLEYRVADAQAQLAFDVVRGAFHGRNFSIRGAHHLAMLVDFDAQLLGHFFKPKAGLRDRAKSYVRRVNGNTADHLARTFAAIADGSCSSATAEAYANALVRAVRADDRALEAEGAALVRAMEAAANRPLAPARAWQESAVAAGLAAVLSVGGAACAREQPLKSPPPTARARFEEVDAAAETHAVALPPPATPQHFCERAPMPTYAVSRLQGQASKIFGEDGSPGTSALPGTERDKHGKSTRHRPATRAQKAKTGRVPSAAPPQSVKPGPGWMATEDAPDWSDDKSLIAKRVAAKSAAVKQCYEAAVKASPDKDLPAGRVKVAFTVGTTGTITDVNVTGADGPFAACIADIFKKIRGLPVLAAPQTHSQTYVFAKG